MLDSFLWPFPEFGRQMETEFVPALAPHRVTSGLTIGSIPQCSRAVSRPRPLEDPKGRSSGSRFHTTLDAFLRPASRRETDPKSARRPRPSMSASQADASIQDGLPAQLQARDRAYPN